MQSLDWVRPAIAPNRKNDKKSSGILLPSKAGVEALPIVPVCFVKKDAYERPVDCRIVFVRRLAVKASSVRVPYNTKQNRDTLSFLASYSLLTSLFSYPTTARCTWSRDAEMSKQALMFPTWQIFSSQIQQVRARNGVILHLSTLKCSSITHHYTTWNLSLSLHQAALEEPVLLPCTCLRISCYYSL